MLCGPGAAECRQEPLLPLLSIPPTHPSARCLQALNLFRRKTGSQDFYRVDLEKVVPHGAGLGGGSGSAATTLWAANELAGRPVSVEQLLEWGGEMGST